ncbi:hypothetical protein [Pseudonocardia alaniniphila]|uniref:Lsr2 protein n=1 Tax=Pseudonocardia alaniniphila TaxID=75291 RepID=A0ABS9T6B4_9PSEU|nr:hypothetical protein [Pseudonocardia alaniniphila]MCH6164072.1 hypothetical protein [Pseudonocardia alaniniphila]
MGVESMAPDENENGSVPGRRISTVVRAVVTQAAPEELPMVDGLSGATDEVIVARLSQGPARDERLGFGLEDVAVLVSPVLYIALDQAVRKIVDDSIDGARRRAPRWARWFARRGKAAPTVPPALSAHHIAEIRDQVTALAKERGVPADKIERVREALVEVLSNDAGNGSAGPPPPV